MSSSLYQFKSLEKYLDDRNFPKVTGSSWKVIKGVDFEKAFKAGKISFEDDGIYLNYDGEKYRGYMFIKTPYIDRYGTYPKFHLTKCETIQKFISSGRFNVRYEWSNASINDLIDKTTGKKYEDQDLDYCHNCKKEILNSIESTSDFHEILRDSHQLEEEVKVDLFGYVKGWKKFSREYRKKSGYCCDSCGVFAKQPLHEKYWQVHHLDGDKTNNKDRNLQCLCILCHANVDSHHHQNFQRKANQVQLEKFIELYRSELIEIKNPYI